MRYILEDIMDVIIIDVIQAILVLILIVMLVIPPVVCVYVACDVADGICGEGRYMVTVVDHETDKKTVYHRASWLKMHDGYQIFTEGQAIYTGDSIVYIEEEKQ